MKHVVVVADMKLGKRGDVLVTHALGSCLGLMVHDPQAQPGPLAHRLGGVEEIEHVLAVFVADPGTGSCHF